MINYIRVAYGAKGVEECAKSNRDPNDETYEPDEDDDDDEEWQKTHRRADMWTPPR